MAIWIKNTQGEPSASLTMSVISFVVVTLWLLAWLVATPFGVPVPSFDAATAMAYLSPILALYFGRRWTSNNGQVTAEGVGERHRMSTIPSNEQDEA
jgi:hypothetical protein